MRFQTIPEGIRENAERHRKNGDRYLAAGLPEYAAGSYRKADRNAKRAQEFEAYLEIDPIFMPLMVRLEKAISSHVFGL